MVERSTNDIWINNWLNFNKGETPASLQIAPEFLTILSKNDIVIDIGCGSGRYSRLLVPYVNKVIGIDINQREINYASSDYQKSPDLNYCVADASILPFKTESFTIAILLGVLGGVNVIHRKNILQEAYRQLKIGG